MGIELWAEDAVRDALLADDDVREIVGTRVFPLMIQQGQPLPAITYQRYSSSPIMTLCGYASENVVILVVAYSTKYGEAKKLAKAVLAALASEPLKAELRHDRDLYSAETGNTGACSVHMEFIVYQSGGY